MTRLEFANRDQALNLDAAIWLDNIRFNIGVSRVPEAGDTGTLFAGFCIALFVFNKFKRFVRLV